MYLSAFTDANIPTINKQYIYIYINDPERNKQSSKKRMIEQIFLAHSFIAGKQLIICAMKKESLHEKLQPPTVIAFLTLPPRTRE